MVQTLIISPPRVGRLIVFPGRPSVRLSVCNSVANLRKWRFTIQTFILSLIMCIQILVSISLFVLRILRTNWILTEMRDRSSVANLRKMTICNTNIDLVNDNVLKKLVTIKVSKGAKIRNRYNQVPHLTQDTNGKVTNSHLDTTNESQEVSPFPAGDHKAHINRRARRHILEDFENASPYFCTFLANRICDWKVTHRF